MNRLYLIAGVVLLLAGLALGWYWFRPGPPKPEPPAPQMALGEGVMALERNPQANAKPAHKVPTGAVVERIVKVSVAPPEIDLTAVAGHSAECPALDVDLTLVRMPDKTRRVIASSSNGRVVSGMDIPVETAAPYKELKWAAGLTANPTNSTFGAFIDRDLGPFRIGAEANQIKDGFDFRLKAGMRF